MSDRVDTAALGGRRCQTCGRVHDALWWKPGDERDRLRAELDEQEGYPGIAHDFEQAKRRAEAAEARAARYEQAFSDLEDVARAALTWAPGNAKIELANRLGAALAAGSGEEQR